MTLQEAIKSGKRFKREGWGGWYHISDGVIRIAGISGPFDFTPISEDILAEDWKTEEQVVSLSESAVRKALDEFINTTQMREDFLRSLGFNV